MLREVLGGELFGCAELLRRTAAELASVRAPRDLPTVLVGGEIYVRCDPFASDFLVDRLERRGLRVRLAPPSEWLEYVSDLAAGTSGAGLADRLSGRLQRLILDLSYALVAAPLGWPPRMPARAAVAAASSYVRPELWGEAVLTLGGALHEWRHGAIDGAVSVGPLECMPNKIAEAQLVHAGEREGLASLTLPMNGDPVDAEILENFVYEVQARYRRRRERRSGRSHGNEDAQVGPKAGGVARGGSAVVECGGC
jgi:predicted nucleotide-binding protein (sugar kinase/HSP70/actin superfamily)